MMQQFRQNEQSQDRSLCRHAIAYLVLVAGLILQCATGCTTAPTTVPPASTGGLKAFAELSSVYSNKSVREKKSGERSTCLFRWIDYNTTKADSADSVVIGTSANGITFKAQERGVTVAERTLLAAKDYKLTEQGIVVGNRIETQLGDPRGVARKVRVRVMKILTVNRTGDIECLLTENVVGSVALSSIDTGGSVVSVTQFLRLSEPLSGGLPTKQP